MKRLLVYSHDTYGLGNARRMLSISRHLGEAIPELSILLVTGSPMMQGFRLSPRLDYIKLPSLARGESEDYVSKSLDLTISESVKLRSDLILASAANFDPDLFLVDKKPFGVKNELEATLEYLKRNSPAAGTVLVLRDILDAPEVTTEVWERREYQAAIENFYELVFVLGHPSVFDPRVEYEFNEAVSSRVRFCGYLERARGDRSREEIRSRLEVPDGEDLALVTVGGGQDGYRVIEAFLVGLAMQPARRRLHSVVFTGSEMPEAQRQALNESAARLPGVRILEFTGDMMSYLDAADVVVSMGGYNTICEILTLRKKAVVVPRCRPVREQLIRAERMSRLGLFKMIHPDDLTPELLMNALLEQLEIGSQPRASELGLKLNAHVQIARWVSTLLER